MPSVEDIRRAGNAYIRQREKELADLQESVNACSPAALVRSLVEALQPQAAPELAAGPAAKPKTRKTAAEYNLEARKYLRTHPDAGPRELKKALGCGTGTVYSLPAFRAVVEQRKKGRKPKAVSLTKPMADAATKADGELAKLVREQQRDARTYKVSSRERL